MHIYLRADSVHYKIYFNYTTLTRESKVKYINIVFKENNTQKKMSEVKYAYTCC